MRCNSILRHFSKLAFCIILFLFAPIIQAQILSGGTNDQCAALGAGAQVIYDPPTNSFPCVVNYWTDTGSANAYAISPTPGAPTAYVAGQTWIFKAANANTGASTLNVSGLGTKNITKTGTTALASGDIKAGQIIEVTYDGTEFQIVSTLPSSGGGGTPGGANTNVQYNNSGAFGGDSLFSWDATNHRLYVGSGVDTTVGTFRINSVAGINLGQPSTSGTRNSNLRMGSNNNLGGYQWITDFNSNGTRDMELVDQNAGQIRLYIDSNGGFGFSGPEGNVGSCINNVINCNMPLAFNGSTGQVTIQAWANPAVNTGLTVTIGAGSIGAAQLASFGTSGNGTAGRVFFFNNSNGTSLYLGPGQTAGHLTISRSSDGHSMLNVDSSGHVAVGDLGSDGGQDLTYAQAFCVGNNVVACSFGVTGTGGVASVKEIATVGTPGVATAYGNVSLTGQTASIATAALCAAASCKVGQYNIDFYLDSTATCATPGPAAVSVALTWTDETGTKSAVTVPLDVNGATSLSASMTLGDTTTSADGHKSVWSTGANAIQYATTLTACTSGTATYAIRAVVTQIQ